MSNALQETRSMLKNLAVEYGPNSPITRIAYNMLEQTELLPTYSRPAWASHEVMTLPWRIEWQKKHLEMIDIVERLRFDSARFEAQFSKGVATNIDEAIAEIERLRFRLNFMEEKFGRIQWGAVTNGDRQ